MIKLTFISRELAETRSRDEWEKILGRPKNKEDITEYYWPVNEDVNTKDIYLEIPIEEESKLAIDELQRTTGQVSTDKVISGK
jgi:hypothetical protein